MFKSKGQSTLEYALIIAVVVAGLLVMQYYLKRGYAGRLRGSADEIGEQFDPTKHSANFTYNQSSNVTQNVTNVTAARTYHQAAQVQNRTGTETISPYTTSETLYPE